jgi:hypothetical protein
VRYFDNSLVGVSELRALGKNGARMGSDENDDENAF